MDRGEQIQTWQTWLDSQGIPSFPLYGILNGQCRCVNGDKCRTPGKHPKIRDWRSITSAYPVSALDNLGVATDSLVVVDVDSSDAVPSDLPETFTVSTGRGIHLWYWARPEHPIRNAAGWRRKVDIRGVGGLVAAPTSKHISGAIYHYLGGEIQPVPDVVLEERPKYVERERKPQVTQIPYGTHAAITPLISALVEEVESAPSGERNHTLFRCLCRYFELADTGWAGEDSLNELFQAAKRNGLSTQEILATIDSASRSLTR